VHPPDGLDFRKAGPRRKPARAVKRIGAISSRDSSVSVSPVVRAQETAGAAEDSRCPRSSTVFTAARLAAHVPGAG
jgi:hypothetical protein